MQRVALFPSHKMQMTIWTTLNFFFTFAELKPQ